jgi:hypothetical protein
VAKKLILDKSINGIDWRWDGQRAVWAPKPPDVYRTTCMDGTVLACKEGDYGFAVGASAWIEVVW